VKVVLDTNVFISGIFFSGPPFSILKAWRDRRLRIVVSAEILDEYRRVGERLGKEFSGVDLEPFLALLAIEADVVFAPSLPECVCEDPDDDKFIACALAGGCKLIVSGDKLLKKVSGYRGIKIVSPRSFLDSHLKKYR
jgi:putative PIN family toxin of toxin-antitoxin system